MLHYKLVIHNLTDKNITFNKLKFEYFILIYETVNSLFILLILY